MIINFGRFSIKRLLLWAILNICEKNLLKQTRIKWEKSIINLSYNLNNYLLLANNKADYSKINFK